jgi:uncharacterized protein with NAD-binding domain and iron-sulfur cluster
MRLIYIILLVFILFLSACSHNHKEKQIIKRKINNNQLTGTIEKTNTLKWELKTDKLSKFEKELIKIAVQKWIDNCNNFSRTQKQELCKKIVENEQKHYKNKECEKLEYLKQKCIDERNFEQRNCKQIKEELLKRQCIFQKKYEQAVKNNNIDFCNTLPRTIRKKCMQKMLTN